MIRLPVTFLGSVQATPAPRTSGASALRALVAFAAALLCASSCSPNGAAADASIAELERLVFVRAGRTVLSDNYPCGVAEALLVDRFEVTRDLWRKVAGQWPDPGGLTVTGADSSKDNRDWPAYSTFDEALVWADLRGMRLPTFDEWLFFAAGPSAGYYPWGRQNRASVANNRELGMGRPLPVGCFEKGASWGGLYDLYGNVSEWVTGFAPDNAIPASDLDVREVGYSMGGSYLEASQALHLPYASRSDNESVKFFMRPLPRGTRGIELGLRCCVEAEAFLVARFSGVPVSEGGADRLRSVGRSWGNEARPLLESLRERHPDSNAFAFLLDGASERR